MQVSFLRKKYKPGESSGQGQQIVWHPEHMDDFTLWKAFRSGDEQALVAIFDKFTRPLYNYGHKLVADTELVKDAVQELFIELWESRDRLGDTDSIRFYLYKSLRRKLHKLKAKSERRLFGTLYIQSNTTEPSPEFVIIADQTSAETKEQLMRMLGKLSRRQHEAIFLRYFEELNCDQIAAVMDLSKQGVYNVLHHALNQLKGMVRDEG